MLELNNSSFDCGCDGCSAVVHAQFVLYMDMMGFDRCGADMQRFCDLLVAFPFRHELQ